MPELNINDNSAILAALQAILGFAPEASIIVVLIRHHHGQDEVRNVLRFDIDIDAAARLTTSAAPAFRTIHAAILVAVCGNEIASHAADTLDVIRDSLTAINITTMVRLITPSLAHSGQWIDIDSGERGLVTPFTDSLFAAEKVLRGERIAASRNEITAEFIPTTNPAPFVSAEPAEFLVDTFETIAAIISGSAHPDSSPELASRSALLIGDVQLRDTALLLCLDHADSAARLWTRIANQLTGRPRLESLTLAAACYYAASDTIRAGIALDTAATEANAQRLDYPRLAQLLLTAYQAGISPTEIREVLTSVGGRGDT